MYPIIIEIEKYHLWKENSNSKPNTEDIIEITFSIKNQWSIKHTRARVFEIDFANCATLPKLACIPQKMLEN